MWSVIPHTSVSVLPYTCSSVLPYTCGQCFPIQVAVCFPIQVAVCFPIHVVSVLPYTCDTCGHCFPHTSGSVLSLHVALCFPYTSLYMCYSTASGSSDPEVTVGHLLPGLFATFHFHSSLLTSCFYVFLHSCCSHAQVFGKTLVHEFHISCCHTEWNMLSSLSVNGDGICKPVLLNWTLNCCFIIFSLSHVGVHFWSF